MKKGLLLLLTIREQERSGEMKKRVFISALMASLFVFFSSCKDKSCSFEDMEYDAATKQCECVQKRSYGSFPELKDNDYNLCETVSLRFNYLSIDNKDYPYYSCAGDTVMFCGYLGNRPEYAFADGQEFLYSIGDDSTLMEEFPTGAGLFSIRCKAIQLKGIDIRKKCFVTGTLSFGYEDFQYEAFPGPGYCSSARLFFNVLEMKN